MKKLISLLLAAALIVALAMPVALADATVPRRIFTPTDAESFEALGYNGWDLSFMIPITETACVYATMNRYNVADYVSYVEDYGNGSGYVTAIYNKDEEGVFSLAAYAVVNRGGNEMRAIYNAKGELVFDVVITPEKTCYFTLVSAKAWETGSQSNTRLIPYLVDAGRVSVLIAAGEMRDGDCWRNSTAEGLWPSDASEAPAHSIPSAVKISEALSIGGAEIKPEPEPEPDPDLIPGLDPAYAGRYDLNGVPVMVKNGKIDRSAVGLTRDAAHPGDWYFCSEGVIRTDVTQIVPYETEWFYVKEGRLDTTMAAIVEYDGGLFAVAAGRLVREYNGLIQNPNGTEWYFVAGGQVQAQHTGLAMYDDHWFYIIGGRLAEDFVGDVEYDGATFHVVNGIMVG